MPLVGLGMYLLIACTHNCQYICNRSFYNVSAIIVFNSDLDHYSSSMVMKVATYHAITTFSFIHLSGKYLAL